MNNYLFKTAATMKEYNAGKWWIDRDIIRNKSIQAEDVNKALAIYAEEVNKGYMTEISRNALKNKSPMYIDTSDGRVKQVGYVVTASSLFDKGDYSGFSKQYFDLWIEILTVNDTVFPEEV